MSNKEKSEKTLTIETHEAMNIQYGLVGVRIMQTVQKRSQMKLSSSTLHNNVIMSHQHTVNEMVFKS